MSKLMKMPEVQAGAHTLKSHGVKVARVHLHDWLILLLLMVVEIILNVIEPFHRFVGAEMMTDIKFPFKGDTIPFWSVPIYAVLLPIAIFFVYYFYRRDVYDLHHAILGLLYSMLITGVITDAIKDAVGRPRPNFFWRCFPDGNPVCLPYHNSSINLTKLVLCLSSCVVWSMKFPVFSQVTRDVLCTGETAVIKEGYKSFPSGHTSWSFAGLGFLAWYLSGKIRAFDRKGHVAKLCIVFLPLLAAALVGVSRVDDYWHHWTDVFTGGLIGSIICSFCYLQLFPFPHNMNGWAPHSYFQMLAERDAAQSSSIRNSLDV